MHKSLSCTATSELLHREAVIYIHFNSEALPRDESLTLKEKENAALAYPYDPGFP
jgi:hypothetical protein